MNLFHNVNSSNPWELNIFSLLCVFNFFSTSSVYRSFNSLVKFIPTISFYISIHIYYEIIFSWWIVSFIEFFSSRIWFFFSVLISLANYSFHSILSLRSMKCLSEFSCSSLTVFHDSHFQSSISWIHKFP